MVRTWSVILSLGVDHGSGDKSLVECPVVWPRLTCGRPLFCFFRTTARQPLLGVASGENRVEEEAERSDKRYSHCRQNLSEEDQDLAASAETSDESKP